MIMTTNLNRAKVRIERVSPRHYRATVTTGSGTGTNITRAETNAFTVAMRWAWDTALSGRGEYL